MFNRPYPYKKIVKFIFCFLHVWWGKSHDNDFILMVNKSMCSCLSVVSDPVPSSRLRCYLRWPGPGRALRRAGGGRGGRLWRRRREPALLLHHRGQPQPRDPWSISYHRLAGVRPQVLVSLRLCHTRLSGHVHQLGLLQRLDSGHHGLMRYHDLLWIDRLYLPNYPRTSSIQVIAGTQYVWVDIFHSW